MIESISQDDICVVSDKVNNILEGRIVVNYVHRQKLKQYKITIQLNTRINTNEKKANYVSVSLCDTITDTAISAFIG